MYTLFPIFSPITVYHSISNIVPYAVQKDLVVYLRCM